MFRIVLAVGLASSTLAVAGFSGEKAGRVKRPAVRAPGGKKTGSRPAKVPKKKFPVAVTPPFDSLVTRRRSAHCAALAKLVERGHELAASAAAEATRLDRLPEHKDRGVQEVLDSVIVGLRTLCAERATMLRWKKGLPAKADAVSGKSVDLTCKNLEVAKLLARAGKGWGLKLELSPLARKLKASLDVDIEGAPTLGQFLDWLSADQALSCGHVGDTVILVPAPSVKLKKAIEAARKKKSKAEVGDRGKGGK